MMSVEKEFPNHVMLDAKNVGTSKALVGNVGIHVYLVSDVGGYWDEKSISGFEKAISKAIKLLETKASEYGTWLKLKYTTSKVFVEEFIERGNWVTAMETAIRKSSFKSVEHFKKCYEEKHGFDDSCIVLAFNRTFRSYASEADSMCPDSSECCVVGRKEGLFTSNFSEGTIMHEILHLFGAKDFYYPIEIKVYAKGCFKRSVMLDTDCKAVDPLTAYLVGWKKHIDEETRLFLNLTKHLTRIDIGTARMRELQE